VDLQRLEAGNLTSMPETGPMAEEDEFLALFLLRFGRGGGFVRAAPLEGIDMQCELILSHQGEAE